MSSRAELILAKQRNGVEAVVPLVFFERFGRFENAEPEVETDQPLSL